MGLFDIFKNADAKQKEEARKAAEAEIRNTPDYQNFVRNERLKAMQEREAKRIHEHYLAPKKPGANLGPIAPILGNLANAANAEFSRPSSGRPKSFENPLFAKETLMFTSTPNAPEWMAKKKKDEPKEGYATYGRG